MVSPEFPLEVRPELFQDVAAHVYPELQAELRYRVASSTLVGVVGVRNCHRRRVSQNFRVVELRPARIPMGPEDLPHGIGEPGPSASRAALKVAWILVEESWKDCLRHVIADYEIAICRAKVPSKSLTTLPKGLARVRQLVLAGEESRQCYGAAIKGILGSHPKLLGAGHRLVILQAWKGKGAVVRNDAENPLALAWRLVVVAAFLGGAWLRRIGGRRQLTPRERHKNSKRGTNA